METSTESHSILLHGGLLYGLVTFSLSPIYLTGLLCGEDMCYIWTPLQKVECKSNNKNYHNLTNFWFWKDSLILEPADTT